MHDDLPVASATRDYDALVKLSGPYYLHTITRLVRDLQPLYELSEPSVVKIDLTGLTFMGPAALALMVASLRRARERGLIAGGSGIWDPDSTGMRTYLYRMDALQVLFEHESIDINDPVRRHATTGLKECQHFHSEEGSRRVARELATALTEKVTTDQVAATSLELSAPVMAMCSTVRRTSREPWSCHFRGRSWRYGFIPIVHLISRRPTNC